MAKAKFHLERRKDKNGVKIVTNIPIRLSFFFNGKRLEYYTQERVSNIKNVLFEGEKEKKKSREKVVDLVDIKAAVVGVKNNEPQAARINQKLKVMARAVESAYDDAIALKQKPSIEYLRAKLDEQFKGRVEDVSEKLVMDAYEEYIQFNKKEMAFATYKKVKVTKGHLVEYVGSRKYTKLKFSDITKELAAGFRDYLINLGQLNNTVVKYTRSFVAFLTWCKNDDRRYFHGDVKIKGSENLIDVIFLSKKEVDFLSGVKLSSPSLERVRDIFIFMCYVGVRYQDAFNLKKSDVKGDYITFFISKGKKTVSQTVPLVSQSKAILKRYQYLPSDQALPVLSNQKMNDYLKEVMQEAKFTEIITIAEKRGDGSIVKAHYEKWELITCHTSRKTFITLAVSSGMKENIIKSITGHSKNSRAFTRYYEVSEEVKREAMNDVFNKKSPASLKVVRRK